MHLILTGLQGSGKTTIGTLLASLLEMPFVDLDEHVRAEHATVRDAYRALGKQAFRDRELECLRALTLESDTVVALGGGTLMHPEAFSSLPHFHFLVYLYEPFSVYQARMVAKVDAALPPLYIDNTSSAWSVLYEQRHMHYSSLSHARVDVAGSVPSSIAAHIAALYTEHITIFEQHEVFHGKQ